MVTLVPPAVKAAFGLTTVTVGAATYVYWAAGDAPDVPNGVVTVTVIGPAVCAGEVAEIWVPELTVKLVAAVPPNTTAVAPPRLNPVMVTEVPPATGPADGVRSVMLGPAT
jgi:hypothetical protein